MAGMLEAAGVTGLATAARWMHRRGAGRVRELA